MSLRSGVRNSSRRRIWIH